jgi:outer membrane protein assembly factor BamB
MRRAILAGLAVLALAAGCSTSDEPGGPASAGPATATIPAGSVPDWTTYHGTGTRAGTAPATGDGAALAWRTRLDGAVYGQPLVVAGHVIAATENDSLYSLTPATGKVRWRTHVGTPVPAGDLPCGNIDPTGITGTPVYDPGTGLVFAVAETTGSHHRLVGLDPRTGTVRVRRDIPAPDGARRYDQQRAALLVAAGRVYVAFGGRLGDCGPYVGSVVGVPTSGHGALVSYRVPTGREGGIWATGGPTLSGDGKTIYVSVGNGESTSGGYDGSDSVVALDLTLHRTGYFAPATWAADNAADLDLGSMSPVVLAGDRVLAAGKRGTGYLLRAGDLGGVGGALAQRPVCPAYGGPAHRGSIAYLPCADGGPAAVDVAGDRIRVRWRGPATADGSPVLTGGTLWVADTASGTLYALDSRTGHTRHTVPLGDELPHFASPTPAGPAVLVGTMHGVAAVATG